MPLPQKTRALLVIIAFLLILILPVSYAIIKEIIYRHSQTTTAPAVKVDEHK